MKREILKEIDRLSKKYHKECKGLTIFVDIHRRRNIVGCSYRLGNFVMLGFSRYNWKHLSDYQKKKVVVHEFCHTLDFLAEGKAHGPQWKKLMIENGFHPSITMRVKE